jgi:hypothetical protein
MQQIQALLREPQDKNQQQVLLPQQQKSTSCPRPLCAACQLSKQGQRVVLGHTENSRRIKNKPSSRTICKGVGEGKQQRLN